MRPEEFSSDRAGRLQKLPEGDWAFVPHPLPPDLQYSSELIRLLSDADRALGELAGLGRTLPNPQLLVQPFIRREAVLSSRIEGTQSDLTDLYAYESGQLVLPGVDFPPPVEDTQEVLNYVFALEYGLGRLTTLPVSLRLIREIHERLMEGARGAHATPGQFRTLQNWIGSPGLLRAEAAYVPPPVPQMQQCLHQLELYLHDGLSHPPIVRLALIHYLFEAIHPFLDGNGRTGRLLISLLLVHWNLLPHPLLYLSAFFERHRSDYYELLSAVSRRGAWEEWVAFFLRGVADQSLDAASRAKRLQDLQAEWRNKLTGSRATGPLFRLVDNLFITPYVTIPRAEKIMGVTYKPAQRGVLKLLEMGVLKQLGENPYGKVFYAEDIVSIILT